MDKKKGATTKKDNSDFENLKAWKNKPDLDYYLSEEHWNFHVNQLLYKNLLVFHEGKEVGAFLYASRDRFTHPINDYAHLYGEMFNEAYRLCYCILASPVPESKVAFFANQAATWKFRNLKDEQGKPIRLVPNVIDLIESYHILGMTTAILSFANDQRDTIDRFLLALSVYKDKGLPFMGFIHCFESYNEVYRAFIVTTLISCSELRPDYDYKKRDEHLRYVIPLYKIFADEIEKKMKESKVNMEQTVLDKISANNIRFYYEGWRNGKHGAICQRDGIYRFIEQVRGKAGLLDDVKRNEEDNPIVAIGIVAYWLMFNSKKDLVLKRLTQYKNGIPQDIRELFDTYTKERFNQFKAAHRDDPLTWDWDWDYEFYTKYIIPHEIELNRSSEVLFDYISDSDIKLVRDVMKSYIKYLKKCRADKGYRVDPELLILRAVDSQDETKYEDLEDYEVNTILEKLKDEGYIDAMWVHGQKLPWVCEMLDKGRVYLKKLEEGEIVPQNNKQSEGSQHEDEQTPSSSTEDDNITNDENIRDWDLFKDWILKDVVIEAIKNIPVGEVVGDVKRHFVIHTVLKEIGWLRHKQATRYIGLMKYHKVVDFAAVDFRDNDLKPFKKINTAEWGSHLTPDSDLGEKYRKFADIVRNTFTRVINGKLDDLERFYVKGKIRYNQVFIDDGNKKK